MPTGVERTRALVLDTSAYAGLRAGDRRILDAIAATEIVRVPVVVLGELEAGFELGSRPDENRVALADFLAEPFVIVDLVTAAVARHYGGIFAALRRAGTPIPLNDVWIAATAIERRGHLLTFDPHFDRVPGLERTVLSR